VSHLAEGIQAVASRSTARRRAALAVSIGLSLFVTLAVNACIRLLGQNRSHVRSGWSERASGKILLCV
jgi:hypothetical protein